MHGISRTHVKYASSRGGPLRVAEATQRCGLRPWIAQARYESSCFPVSMIRQGYGQRADTRCHGGEFDYAADVSRRWV